MKAVVLYDQGKVELRDVERPVCGDEDIIIEVKACGICGSDLNFYYGRRGPMGPVPYTMGHEFAGVIAEMGKNADPRWKIGDRVVSENTGDACGTCPSCSRGDFVACAHRQILGCTMDGGFTKYVRIPGKLLRFYKNCLWKIPDNLSFQEATLMDPAANGYNAVIQQGGLKPGEIVVVYGVGALGIMSIAAANYGGASKIIAVGMHSDRVSREAIARKYGADYFLASDEEEDMAAKIREIAGPDGVAMTVDAAGHPSITKTAIQFTRNQGVIVRIGTNPAPFDDTFDSFKGKNISVIGHMGYNQESWRNCLALASSGKLDLQSIISNELPLEDFHKGFEMSRLQQATKVILIP